MTLIDEESKAELLTFLVVGHLLALVRSGGFLSARLADQVDPERINPLLPQAFQYLTTALRRRW